jgi:hypothetical protein
MFNKLQQSLGPDKAARLKVHGSEMIIRSKQLESSIAIRYY